MAIVGKPTDTLRDLDLRINSKTVLFFDMDGTLIDTNFANFLSYKDAIHQVIKPDIDILYNSNERFNRDVLKKVILNLPNEEYEKIINLKNELYIFHLSETKLNDLLADLLRKYSKTNKTILVTNCLKERALMTLEYHKLIDNFSYKFYKQITDNNDKINKYSNALISLEIPPTSVLVFENEKSEINTAILAGIPFQNIISI